MYYLAFLCYAIGVLAIFSGSWEGIAVAVGCAALGTFIWVARTRLD
jgi:hypothetical protein